ncbi:MAG: (Fe-S)-binding protein [Bacteroidales bacterium]|jgi:Fe-S oxidoreductase|nr:(Fe-S)-binding protein [Bacteroidales bacterium]
MKNIKSAIDIFLQNTDNKLLTALNSCVHCNLCCTSCHFYKASPKLNYSPSKKVDVVASVYRKYGTFTGKFFPQLVHAKALDEKTIREMTDLLFGSCTLCGRCATHCSVGVDIPFVVKTGRRMLAAMGYVPDSLKQSIQNTLTTGNNMALTEEDFVDTVEWMQEESQDEMGTDFTIPIDKLDCDYFYTLNPREVKFYPLSIAAVAKIFYAAHAKWTLSTQKYDITNYGYFSGDNKITGEIAAKIYDEVTHLKAKTLVLGECGHGSRTLRWEAPNILKQKPDFEILTMLELIAHLLKSGKIKVNPIDNNKVYTIHDPCNISRNGGLFDIFRFVVKSIVKNVVEMTPTGIDNFCCGGGGGLLAMGEYNDRRILAGKMKADQIRATGANVVITTCHNCIDQLVQLNHTYDLHIEVKSVAEIVADVL